jgi:translation initiation factor IF-1
MVPRLFAGALPREGEERKRRPLCHTSNHQRRLSFRPVCEVLSTGGTGHPHQHLMREQHIEIEGVVNTVLPGTMFRVELDNKHLVLATISGKMRKRWVRLTAGDRVKMEMSPYDLDKARIVWRLR